MITAHSLESLVDDLVYAAVAHARLPAGSAAAADAAVRMVDARVSLLRRTQDDAAKGVRLRNDLFALRDLIDAALK